MFTGEFIREIIFSSAWYIHVNQTFFTVVATYTKASVFDVEELTNKDVENDQLWQRDFLTDKRDFNSYGEAMKSKMVVATGKKVKIYDFWQDKDYEVTEDTNSDEESVYGYGFGYDESSEDFDESDDEIEGNRDRGVKERPEF